MTTISFGTITVTTVLKLVAGGLIMTGVMRAKDATMVELGCEIAASALTGLGSYLYSLYHNWEEKQRESQVSKATTRQAVANATGIDVSLVPDSLHTVALAQVKEMDKSGVGVPEPPKA